MASLPPGITVLERGWLSANNVVFTGGHDATVVDTGYCTHSAQTVALVESVLQGRQLCRILNTHLHSDHCGGNAALQHAFPAARTFVPPGMADAVRGWDEHVLSYAATGQQCPRFALDGVLAPGSTVELGGLAWQVHGAPGHDPESVILFEPRSRTLISADALWRNGFGVVFPELEGEEAFATVGDTLDLIDSLAPSIVIPGHGSVFTEVDDALAQARRRLASFVSDPARHAAHAGKVLLKFRLLELQEVREDAFLAWARGAAYLPMVHARYFPNLDIDAWLGQLVDELVRAGAAARRGAVILDV